MNHIIAENFMRSAIAPQISAGVMIANVIWKHMNTDSGIVGAALATESVLMPISSMREKPPIKFVPSVKAKL